MGTSANAHCSVCEYRAAFLLGGGMMNFETYAAWPVHRTTCQAITTANYRQQPLTCQACNGTDVTPIGDPREWQGDGKQIEMWETLTLTDGHYRCPKCGKFELRFTFGGIQWD